MGSKNKLKRFQENETFDNVFQPTRSQLVDTDYQYKGQWNAQVFKNNNPIVLELGCGKGEYTVALAKKYPKLYRDRYKRRTFLERRKNCSRRRYTKRSIYPYANRINRIRFCRKRSG